MLALLLLYCIKGNLCCTGYQVSPKILSSNLSSVFAERRVCEISFSYLNKITKGQNPIA